MKNSKKNYQAWEVNKKDFPVGGGLKQKMEFLLKYAVLAPSSLNSQPWKFELANNSITILADRSKILKSVDPTFRDFYISIGCSIANIIEAAKGFSLSTEIKLNNNQSSPICATILITDKNKEERESLIEYIPKRFSDKGPYNDKKIAKSTLDILNNFSSETCYLTVTSEKNIRLKIIDLVVEADHKVMSDSMFRNEISHWLKPNFTNSTTGMPGFTMGLNLFQSIIGPYVVRGFKKFAEIQSKKDRKLLLSSPYFGIISIYREDKINLLEAGILYEKICLYATKSSIRINPLSAIIEFDGSKGKLKTLFKSENNPVMFFRMGYSNNKELHSPREGYKI